MEIGAALVLLAVLLVVVVPVLAVVKIVTAFLLSIRLNETQLTQKVRGRHVVVTGGSRGLGLSLATRFARSGANVTLVARASPSLDAALSSVAAAAANPASVRAVAVDLSDYLATKEKIAVLLKEVITSKSSHFLNTVNNINNNDYKTGKIDWLIANAGASYPDFLANQLSVENSLVDATISTNYYTALNIIRSVFAAIKESTNITHNIPANITNSSADITTQKPTVSGFTPAESALLPSKIIIVGSTLSFISFLGYSAYSSSKYALRGLADSLRSELLPLNINVHFLHPGNMDTPGYIVENTSKPSIVKKIDGASQLVSAGDAADALIAGVLVDRYAPTNDLISELLRVSGSVSAPRPNPVSEVLGVGLLVFIFNIYLAFIDWDIAKDAKKGGFLISGTSNGSNSGGSE
ncbi:3-dehydrosphinganine reductase [Physocladia obscura]|uniref:3-dehydrosphinganine reductase n=1 Tax=Physocladia obscura TaxID=109957 RepID=A0AAD5TCC8_9FUNG|nr:3-dehydrosphinganine reductase [Physocladia obscura]